MNTKPWFAGESRFSRKALVKTVKDFNGVHFCAVNNDENAESNIKLIASSPELFESCKMALNCLKVYADSDQENADTLKIISMLESAIRKTEGK